MRIYLDLDSRLILSSPTRPLSILEFKRRDTDLLELQFVRSGAVVEVSSSTSVRYGLKAADQYAADFLSTGSFAKTGTGTAAVYTASFSLNTQPIADAFDAEPKSISAMLELEYTDGTTVSSSITLPVTLHNDVIRGDEATPESIPESKATQAEAEAGVNHSHWMTPLRTAQAIAALSAGGGVSSWNDLTDKPSTFPPATHDHDGRYYTETETDTLLAGKQAAGSYATLVGGLVPSTQLPSYVDDVIEAENFAALPTGETGKIYVTLDTGKIYRWSGTAFIEISPSPGSTDAVPEGSSNLYFTAARAVSALASTLSSYATQAWVTAQGYATSSSVTAAISALVTGVSSVAGKTGAVTLTKTDVGLGNCDNTSDLNKPISTATQTALDGKAAASHTHDDRYYTETEMNTLLAGKQASGSYAPATGIAASAITGTAVITTDPRLSDSRSPLSHTHGNITNAGAIGSTAGLPIITGASGVLQAGSFGTTSGTFAAGDHTHSNFVVNGGNVSTIVRVTAMPATPVANTLYIVIP
jgi:hypothetical protein